MSTCAKPDAADRIEASSTPLRLDCDGSGESVVSRQSGEGGSGQEHHQLRLPGQEPGIDQLPVDNNENRTSTEETIAA